MLPPANHSIFYALCQNFAKISNFCSNSDSDLSTSSVRKNVERRAVAGSDAASTVPITTSVSKRLSQRIKKSQSEYSSESKDENNRMKTNVKISNDGDTTPRTRRRQWKVLLATLSYGSLFSIFPYTSYLNSVTLPRPNKL